MHIKLSFHRKTLYSREYKFRSLYLRGILFQNSVLCVFRPTSDNDTAYFVNLRTAPLNEFAVFDQSQIHHLTLRISFYGLVSQNTRL